MASPKMEEFLKDVLSHIKYPFVREEIKKELKDHILDKACYYREEGYDWKEAESLAIKDMGDPKEIGSLLNKEHNPIIGWLITVTSTLVALLILINSFMVGPLFLVSTITTISTNPAKRIPKEDIVYKIDVNEKVQIDDRVIKFTDVIYDKKGELHIIYKYYDKKFWRIGGWSLGSIGDISDDKGNEYFPGSGNSSGGFISRGRRGVRDFPPDAKAVIIEYDSYNRYYKVEIPLNAGEAND